MAKLTPPRSPTEELDSFGDGVDKFDLFVVVLVVKQVKLIKSGTSDLPMGFLV
jgi:hypothetical protein